MIGGRRERDPLSDDLAALDELQDEVSRPPRRPTTLIVPILITMIVMTGGVTIAWYSYNAGVKEGSEGAAPLLKPDGPMKVAPDSPGGTQIPHKKLTIYESLNENSKESKVERILPPPERPLTPPAASSAPAEGEKPAENSRVRSADKVPGPAAPEKTVPNVMDRPSARTILPPSPPPTAENQPKVAANPPATQPAPKAPAATPPEKEVGAAPVKPAPAPEPKVAAVPQGRYKVQIGSVSSEDQAGRLWNIQSGKSNGLLSQLTMHIEKKVIKGKAYYRIQAGPLKDAASARNLCAELKKRQVGCFVVHPKK
jgi:cell division protein FtsN